MFYFGSLIRPHLRGLLKLGIVVLIALVGVSNAVGAKLTIGAVEKVRVLEGNVSYLGRVDTGAKTTSINAHSIRAHDGFVAFTLENASGDKADINTKIVKQSPVRTADSEELRYFVWLTLVYKGRPKRLLVNLNDRSLSRYKILLGRNWLSGDFVVDVEH